MPKFVLVDLPARMRDLIISSSTTLKSHTFTEWRAITTLRKMARADTDASMSMVLFDCHVC